MTPLNYAANAQRGLEIYASLINESLSSPTYLRDAAAVNKDVAKKDIATILWVRDMIGSAVHFSLPESGKLFDDGLKGLRGTAPRLPYPLITLEYRAPVDLEEIEKLNQTPAEKRLVLAAQPGLMKDGELEAMALRGSAVAKHLLRIREMVESRILVFGLFSTKELHGLWNLLPVAWELDEQWDNIEGAVDLNPDDHIAQPNGVFFRGNARVIMPWVMTAAAATSETSVDTMLRLSCQDLSHEIRSTMEFCEALSCTNVKVETMTPGAPETVNERRRKAGKLPIYEIKHLTVEVPGHITTGGKFTLGYDRSPPRQHLRRGHIRRLTSGKNVWVNSCVVGSAGRGVIEKDYVLTTSH